MKGHAPYHGEWIGDEGKEFGASNMLACDVRTMVSIRVYRLGSRPVPFPDNPDKTLGVLVFVLAGGEGMLCTVQARPGAVHHDPWDAVGRMPVLGVL